MKRLLALSIACLTIATAVPAVAQTPSVELQPTDPGSAVVEELLVVARPPGPALWLVEKNGAKYRLVPMAWNPVI